MRYALQRLALPAMRQRQVAAGVTRHLVARFATETPTKLDFLVIGHNKLSQSIIDRLARADQHGVERSVGNVRQPLVSEHVAQSVSRQLPVFQAPVGSLKIERSDEDGHWSVSSSRVQPPAEILAKEIFVTEDPVGIALNKIQSSDGSPLTLARMSKAGVIDTRDLLQSNPVKPDYLDSGDIVLFGNDQMTRQCYENLRAQGIQPIWVHDMRLPWSDVLRREPTRGERDFLINDHVLGVTQDGDNLQVDCLSGKQLKADIVVSHLLEHETLRQQMSSQGHVLIPGIASDDTFEYRAEPVETLTQGPSASARLFGQAAAQCLPTRGMPVPQHVLKMADALVRDSDELEEPAANQLKL